MSLSKLKNILLYAGVSKEEYEMILPHVRQRNKKTLRITSFLSILLGAGFLAYTLFSHKGTWLPYLILLIGSTALFILNRLTDRNQSGLFGVFLCYGQMALVCVYAGLLSVQTSNYALPATSIVVFIALLPLGIDDSLIRMFSFMLIESSAYLVTSHFFKSPEAFSLDVINVVTFFAIGMVLYSVICVRNVREIYQGLNIEKIQRSIISSMATVVEERDESTGGHIQRTESYVRALIGRMKKVERYSALTEEYYYNVVLAAPMHDIGKIKVSDAILNKPGRLTSEEYEIMKKHAAYGDEIIRKTMQDVEEKAYFDVACNIAKYHHERYDGNGYPEGLSGEQIPLESRIMALADVYDALVSERVYKKAFSREEARRIIAEGSGTQFDPHLAKLFLECV